MMRMNILIDRMEELRDNPFLQALHAFAKRQGVTLYLVGGSVRDLLLSRVTTDFDFTLKSDAVQFAKMFAKNIGASFIPLNGRDREATQTKTEPFEGARAEMEPWTARVIVRSDAIIGTQKRSQTDSARYEEILNIDFAEFRAASLSDDLRERDLTINAMAIPLESVIESADPEVIDPCNGLNDLAARQLRFLSEQVIIDDPLRLMRIYRFAAQLNFEISDNSVVFVGKHNNLLGQVSKERIRDELFKILNNEKARKYLEQMFEIGLLSQVFPSMRSKLTGCGTEEDEYVVWNLLGNFEECSIPSALDIYQSEVDSYLSEELGLYTDRRSLIKLCLIYQGHPGKMGSLLRLSRKAVQFMKCLYIGQQHFADVHLTKKQIIDFLRFSRNDWLGVLLYATVIHSIPSESLTKIAEIYHEYFLPIVRQGRLITGEDLIRKYHLTEGEKIGALLKQIEDMQFYGEIGTRAEAFEVVEALIGTFATK